MSVIEKFITKHGEKVTKSTVKKENIINVQTVEIFEKKEVVVLLEDGRQLLM